MAENTRDISIEARESAAAAHKRLDTINGQIAGLRDDIGDVRVDVGKLGVKVALSAAAAAAIATSVVGAVATVVVKKSIEPRAPQPTQAAQIQRH